MTFQDKLRKALTESGIEEGEPHPDTAHELREQVVYIAYQLFKEEVEQIIGEPERHSNGHKMVTSWTCDDCGLPTEAFTRNDLRREQRARLNKTIEEK